MTFQLNSCRNSAALIIAAVLLAACSTSDIATTGPSLRPRAANLTIIPASASVDPTTGHGYEIVASASSWTAASVAAQAKGGYLARINSPAEQAFVTSLLASAAHGQFWIGGISAPVSGCSWSWTDGTGISTPTAPCSAAVPPQWISGNPKVGPEYGGPSYMSMVNLPEYNLVVGSWNTEIDTQGFYSIVEYDTQAPAANIITDPASGQRYEFFYTPETFEAASAIAAAKGGYLARITTALEQSFVTSLLASQPRVQFWIGGQRIPTATCAWSWQNGVGIATPGNSTCGGYSNWSPEYTAAGIPANPSGDPSYRGTGNFYLTLLNQDYFYTLYGNGGWNDLPTDVPMLVDALIEYDAPAAPPVVIPKYNALCTLTMQYVSQHGVANSLCVKLNNAAAAEASGQLKPKQNLINAYINEVRAQTGKFISAANVATLINIARTL